MLNSNTMPTFLTVLLFCIVVSLISACKEQSSTRGPEGITLQDLQQEAIDMRKDLPMQMGPGVVWRTSEAQPGLKIVHKYEFERIAPIPEIIRLLDKQQDGIARTNCNDTSVRFLLDGSVTIVYEYALQDGTLLTTNTVSLNDCF